MSGERKVIRVVSPKLGDAGWKTMRSALGSWARTTARRPPRRALAAGVSHRMAHRQQMAMTRRLRPSGNCDLDGRDPAIEPPTRGPAGRPSGTAIV